MRANNRSAKPRKQWRLLRRAEQARRAADRIKTNERVRRYTREARRNGADAMGLMQAVFRGVYEDALGALFSPPSNPLFDAFPFSEAAQEAGRQYVEARTIPAWQEGPEPGRPLSEPLVMTPPPGGWAQNIPDDEKPEWPYRWKPKAWLTKRGFKRLLPEPWP